MPRGHDERVGTEGRRGPHDRADIMRVGDLVEEQDQPSPRQVGEPKIGERLGFDQHALMDGVFSEQPVEVLRRDRCHFWALGAL